MTRQNAFEQFVAFADKNNQIREPISQEEFELWQKDVIIDALHGIRYGQSFCNRFDISDNLLYYTTWPHEQQHDYIRKNYIARI